MCHVFYICEFNKGEEDKEAIWEGMTRWCNGFNSWELSINLSVKIFFHDFHFAKLATICYCQRYSFLTICKGLIFLCVCGFNHVNGKKKQFDKEWWNNVVSLFHGYSGAWCFAIGCNVQTP